MKDATPKRTPIEPKLLKDILQGTLDNMSDTGIIGACKECEMVSTLEIGPGFNLSQLDKASGGGVISAWCPRCNKTVEFIPHQHFLEKAHEQTLQQQRSLDS